MNDVRTQLAEVFRDVFDDDSLELSDSMTAADVEGWDSLQHINLIVAVEKVFGIKFAAAEIGRLKDSDQNVGTFTRLIESKVAAGA